VGDLTVADFGTTGQSSTASGYNSGGNAVNNTLAKFSFSSDGNATDVGDLSVGLYGPAGTQV
jgi:hypothetical protein